MRRIFGLIIAGVLGLSVTGDPVTADAAGAIAPREAPPALADLGKRLFHDERLSGDTSLACASCHQPDKAFTNGEALSAAYTGAGHFRNPTPFPGKASS